MVKYALFNVPAYGHVNSKMAVVRELVARGEQVVYYLTEEFRTAIEATGSTFHLLSDEMFQGVDPLTTSGGPGGSSHLVDVLPLRLQRLREQILPAVLESLRAEPVDCILYDPMCLWGLLAAKILRIPAISMRSTYAVNEKSRPFGKNSWQESQIPHKALMAASQVLVQICQFYNLPKHTPFTLFNHIEALNIVFQPRAFQPGGDTFDERFLFVGPSLSMQRDEQVAFSLAGLDQRPLLYISLGTVFNNWVDFFNMCFDAFGNTHWQVVLSTGKAIDLAELQAVPANFQVAAYVPQLFVLQHAGLFVTHGGMNSVMESLAYGVPMVVVPQMLEQEITAQRVQELGLGIALDRNTLTMEMLRAAVEDVESDPQARGRLQTMQEAIRTSGGYKRAADAVMAFSRKNVINTTHGE